MSVDMKPAALEMSKNKLKHRYFKISKMEEELNVLVLTRKQKQNPHKISLATEDSGPHFAFYIVVLLILYVLSIIFWTYLFMVIQIYDLCNYHFLI